ncbi:MAG: P1 family peptidase, partial [Pseudomonadota bacterium]
MEKQPIDPSAEGSPGPLNALEDVPGLGIGHAHDSGVKTGVSVVLTAQPMVCAVDVRGGGPGTRETDLLDPAALVQTVDAVVLAGGSTYGLAAADAVAAHLGAAGRGFALIDRPGVPRSPIVPAAI